MHTFGILRDIQSNELEIMLSWRNHDKVRLASFTQNIISLQEHLEWWKKTKKSNSLYFMYEFNKIPHGIASFNNIDEKNKNASWSFYTSPNAPLGTGTKMEFLILDFAFRSLCLHKLYCEVLASNPSLKFHEKFGFKIEGVFRNQYLANESYIDVYRLGILKGEWSEKREEIITKLISYQKLK